MNGITSQSFKLKRRGPAQLFIGAIRATVSESRCRVVPFPTFHLKVGIPLGTESVLSFVGYFIGGVGLDEDSLAHYFGPSFPPMYHLDTCPLSRVIYPLHSYNARTMISSPPL